VKESKEIGQIQRLGSNYVIIETYEGLKQRKWLKDVVRIEEAAINKLINWSTPSTDKKIKSFKELN